MTFFRDFFIQQYICSRSRRHDACRDVQMFLDEDDSLDGCNWEEGQEHTDTYSTQILITQHAVVTLFTTLLMTRSELT